MNVICIIGSKTLTVNKTYVLEDYDEWDDTFDTINVKGNDGIVRVYSKKRFKSNNIKMDINQITQKITEFEKEPIRLQGLLKKRKETLEEFLVKFFSKWNEELDTIYVNSKRIQTLSGKRRSIGDIYLICKYYYPKCTLKEVSDLLYGPLRKKIPNFRSSKCSMIHKRVFYQGDSQEQAQFYQMDENDEYGMKPEQWLNAE